MAHSSPSPKTQTSSSSFHASRHYLPGIGSQFDSYNVGLLTLLQTQDLDLLGLASSSAGAVESKDTESHGNAIWVEVERQPKLWDQETPSSSPHDPPWHGLGAYQPLPLEPTDPRDEQALVDKDNGSVEAQCGSDANLGRPKLA